MLYAALGPIVVSPEAKLSVFKIDNTVPESTAVMIASPWVWPAPQVIILPVVIPAVLNVVPVPTTFSVEKLTATVPSA